MPLLGWLLNGPDLTQFLAPDTIINFVLSALPVQPLLPSSSTPAEHVGLQAQKSFGKLSRVLRSVMSTHASAMQCALPRLVPAVVSAIQSLHYAAEKWAPMLGCIGESLPFDEHTTHDLRQVSLSFTQHRPMGDQAYGGGDMAPHIEPLSACLGRVSAAVVQDEIRLQVITTISLMGIRHAQLLSPRVLQAFPPIWSSWSSRRLFDVANQLSLRWEEPAEGLANLIAHLATIRPDDWTYRAPFVFSTLMTGVLQGGQIRNPGGAGQSDEGQARRRDASRVGRMVAKATQDLRTAVLERRGQSGGLRRAVARVLAGLPPSCIPPPLNLKT